MEKIDFIKQAILLLGMSTEDVVQNLATDVSSEFLLKLLQSRITKLATDTQMIVSARSETQNQKTLASKSKPKRQYKLFKASSGKIKVGMFYYNKGKTFSEHQIDDKQLSGRVVYVDKTGQHGLISVLKVGILPWSSDDLVVGLPDGLSGKENTHLILEAAQKQGKTAEAAKFCATYAYDGIKAREAFLPSIEELKNIFSTRLGAGFYFDQECEICDKYLSSQGLDEDDWWFNAVKEFEGRLIYWSSSEQKENSDNAWLHRYKKDLEGYVHGSSKQLPQYVRPVVAF